MPHYVCICHLMYFIFNFFLIVTNAFRESGEYYLKGVNNHNKKATDVIIVHSHSTQSNYLDFLFTTHSRDPVLARSAGRFTDEALSCKIRYFLNMTFYRKCKILFIT